MQIQPPKREVSFDNVPTYAVSGFFGGVNPNEANISFFQDQLIPQIGHQAPGQIALETVEHKFVATIKISPAVFKRMAFWMMEHVKRYEQQFGEIKLDMKPQNKKEESDTPSYYG